MKFAGLSQVTGPLEQAVSLADARLHLRIDNNEEDAYISALIDTATSAIEEDTGRKLVSQSWRLTVPRPSDKVSIPIAPVTSVTSMTYYDTDDVSQSLTVSDYYLFSDMEKATIQPKTGISWPAMKDRPDALTVTFTVGYSAVGSIPIALKHAIFLMVAHWYENRVPTGKAIENLPLAYQYIIAQHKIGWAA